MLLRTVLCAALMVPVMGMAPASNKVSKSIAAKPVVMSTDVMPSEVCPFTPLGFNGTVCEWVFEVCGMPLWFIEIGECDWESGGCPCDEGVAAVQMPDVDGKATFAVRNATEFTGIPVPANVYRGAAPPKTSWNKGVEMIFDGPAVIGGKPYRLMSLTFRGQRFDIGREMVGVSAETMKSYPKGKLMTVFGNNLQAAASVNGQARTFQLRSVGKSSVKELDLDKPLLPVPDNTIPAL